MDRKVAKELLHGRDWLDRAQDVVARGQEAYTTDELLQEAGDSLMMKLGEAAGRLARANVEPPPGVAWTDAIANRNWLIPSVRRNRPRAHLGHPLPRPDLLASCPDGDVHRGAVLVGAARCQRRQTLGPVKTPCPGKTSACSQQHQALSGRESASTGEGTRIRGSILLRRKAL